MRRIIYSALTLTILLTGCTDVTDEAAMNNHPELDRPEYLTLNSMEKDSQRDYGWHKNRLSTSSTGKFKDRGHGDSPYALQYEAKKINDSQAFDHVELTESVKRKIEQLRPVNEAYVVNLGGILYIGLESDTVNERDLNKAIKDIVANSSSNHKYKLFTDRASVNRIRAAEKAEHPEYREDFMDFLNDMEYEIQKGGNGWLQ